MTQSNKDKEATSWPDDEYYMDVSNSTLTGMANAGYVTNVSNNGLSWASHSSHVVTEGDFEVTGELTVGGRRLIDELDEMREILLLLKRDVNMEEKYPRLKEIKEEYELALEKYKLFDALKGKDK